jgi:hypothetical protein
MFRGTSNSCRINNWAALVGGCDGNPFCREAYDPGGGTGSDIHVTLESGDDTLDLCFEGNGVVFFGDALAPGGLVDRNTLGGGFVFRLERPGSDEVVRRVVLPLGAAARVLR